MAPVKANNTMNASTLQILAVIRQYLITVSVQAVMQYAGMSEDITRAGITELVEHGWLEHREGSVYVKTHKWD